MVATSYRLQVGGAAATPDLLAALQAVEVEDHAQMPDMCRLRVAVGVSEGGSRWSVLDDDLFRRLTPVKVLARVGSSGAEPLFDGYVVETRAVLSNEPGKSHLDVVAMDPTVLMSLDERVRAWPNVTESDVASTLFGEHGFGADVEATSRRREEASQTLVQRGTDLQFLKRLASRVGYEVFVDVDARSGEVKGHFHRPRLETEPQGVLTVNMGDATTVNRFQARFDMLRPVTAEVTGVDAESGEPQPAQVESVALRNLGRETPIAERPRRVLPAQTGLAEGGELTAFAQAVVDRASWAIRAEGELNAASYGGILRAKKPVLVRGAGRRFSGAYYVERVQHVLTGDGYLQRFALRRNALGLTGQESFEDDRQAVAA